MLRSLRIVLLGFALSLVAGGCVSVDPETGKAKPRGRQRYEFSVVEKNAKRLRIGMSKTEVLLLLGSPAEQSGDGSEWVYLPERAAILIPAHALKLQFRNGALQEHGFHLIVLGARL